jgi:type IV pilus assembly protein PilV
MEPSMHTKRATSRQTGSVLLEALIAILIFSIGILALVGMQATAINAVSDSKYRSTAGFLTNQIIGTVMTTSQSVTVNVSGVSGSSSIQTTTVSPSFACSPCGAANGNNYTQAWVQDVATQLPNSIASMVVTSSSIPNTVTVELSWRPPKDANPHHHTATAFIN